MSARKILFAVMLIVAQVSLPALAQPPKVAPAQKEEINRMEGLAHAMNVAIARATVLGRGNPNNLQEIAKVLDVSSLDPQFAARVIAADQAMQNLENRKYASAWERETFPAGGVRGDRKTQIDAATLASAMLDRSFAQNRKEVMDYCSDKDAAQSELCGAIGVLDQHFLKPTVVTYGR